MSFNSTLSSLALANLGQAPPAPLLSPDPCSNTGSDSHPPCNSPACTSNSSNSNYSWYARVDWLQGVRETAKIADFLFLLSELEKLLNTSFDLHWDEPRYIGTRWDGFAVSPLGALICYRLIEQKGNSTVPSEESLCSIWFALPGECWSTTPVEQHSLLINLIPRFGFRITRLDLALDDYKRTLKFNDIITAIKNGNFSGAKNYYVHESGQRDNPEVGIAVVFGSPQSDKRLTIYDKFIESKGKINSIRLELRLRDELSNSVFLYLYGKNFAPIEVAAAILGSVKFLDRTKGDKNLDRLPLLKWWKRFIEYIEAVPFKTSRPKVVRHVESTVNWLCRQVSSTLTVLSRVMGNELINKLLSIGDLRYKRITWYRSLEKSFRYNLKDLIAAFEKHILAEPTLPGDGSRWDWGYGWIPAGEQGKEEVLAGIGESSLGDSPVPVQFGIPGLELGLPELPERGAVSPWLWEMQ